MNEKTQFFGGVFLLQSTGDRERPIAINADQPKLLPEQQTDRMQSRRGVDFFPHVLCVCARLCCFVQGRQRECTHGAGRQEESNGCETENKQPVI